MFFSGFLFVVISAGISVVVWQAARGGIPPNNLIGIRVGKIDDTPEIWQAAHKAALPATLVASSIGIITGIIFWISPPPISPDLLALCGGGGVLLFASIATMIAWIKAGKLSDDHFLSLIQTEERE